jgi:ribonucleoside-diphosphate reductase alpha chain
MWKSNRNPQFRTQFSENIFNQKYAHEGAETWDELCVTLVHEVCGDHMSMGERGQLIAYMRDLKFIPGGRYLYYAGRPNPFYNNCYLLRAEEDSREDWANLSWKAESCLMTGGGIGADYSVYRPSGSPIARTGGMASGPLPKMEMLNEIGRRVMQGGSRRSAIYASLNWLHADAPEFLTRKDWDLIRVPGTDKTLKDLKALDFNWPAPLDMTNISLNYDDAWLAEVAKGNLTNIYRQNVYQALRTAEPGFSFNFGDKQNETLRNACTEVTSEDDSDVCNLGSLNLGRIESLDEFRAVVELATKFLVCGTLRAKLPYAKVYETREKNRRLGLGLMGVHEWLIKKGHRYEVGPELRNWLAAYKDVSSYISRTFSDSLGISRPVAQRAIAPTGTIGILAGTTTGIEPLFAVAYKRRYLKNGTDWHYQYVVDGTAQELIDLYGADPERIESAVDLAADYERRIRFQADVQDYVDQAISSTINLPAWGTELNNEDKVDAFAETLARYAPRLRGFTCYPDGARGGQPLTSVPYAEAVTKLGEEFREEVVHTDICDLRGGGTCGI